MFADALSRPPADSSAIAAAATAATFNDRVYSISLDEIAMAQRSDPYLREIRAGKPCPKNLIFINKAYYHSDGTLYVPLSVRRKVLQACLLYTSPSPRDS